MNIQFYFDPISPYCWLAGHQIKTFQDKDEVIDCLPVLLAGFLQAFGQKGPAEIPSKRSYTHLDIHRRANAAGLRCSGPPTHPFNPLAALRACHCIEDPLQRFEFAITLMDMAWAEGEDLTKIDTLQRAVQRCELDLPDLETRIQDPAIKAKLRSATESAIELGVFGVPMLCVQGERFWGSDRVQDAFAAARGNRAPIDLARVEAALSRPASASRKRSDSSQ